MTNDTKKQSPDKNIQSAKRRGVLKSMGGSAAAVVAAQNLPEAWKKPLVDSIVLPSHAVTTDDTGSSSGGDTTTTAAATTAAATTTTTAAPTTTNFR